MSDQESAAARKRAARVLIALFAVGASFAGVGVVTFVNPPQVPTGFVPCDGDPGICRACVAPTRAQCQRLMNCGGNPCPESIIVDGGYVDPYQGPPGRLAKGIREAMERGAIGEFHSDIATLVDGGIGSCATVLYMNRDQRAAFLRTVDAVASGSQVVDCRTATMPAAFRLAPGVRRSVVSGMSADGSQEADPDSTVGLLDAGPE